MGLIEIVIGAAIVGIALVSLMTALQKYMQVGLQNGKKIQAAYFAEEGIEVMRGLRDSSFASFAALGGGTYYLGFSGASWNATTTATTTLQGFTRTVAIEGVYRRNSDNDIVPATSTEAKYLDPGTMLVTVTVTWGGGLASSLVAYEGGVTDENLASFPSNNAGDGDPAQGFTTPASAKQVGQIDLYLKRVGNPSDIYLEMRSGSTVGSILATSNTVDADTISSSALSFVTFTFPTTPQLSASTLYYLRLRSIPSSTVAFSGSAGTLNWGYLQSAQSPYAGGQAYRYVSRQGNQADQGQALSQYDYSFRVTTPGGGSSVSAATYLTNLFHN